MTLELIEYFIFENNIYVIMEYCNGGDLFNHVLTFTKNNPGQCIPSTEINLIIANIATGLKDLHGLGIMHRDIKSRNILLIKDENGAVTDAKLCDFGLSSQAKEYAAKCAGAYNRRYL